MADGPLVMVIWGKRRQTDLDAAVPAAMDHGINYFIMAAQLMCLKKAYCSITGERLFFFPSGRLSDQEWLFL